MTYFSGSAITARARGASLLLKTTLFQTVHARVVTARAFVTVNMLIERFEMSVYYYYYYRLAAYWTPCVCTPIPIRFHLDLAKWYGNVYRTCMFLVTQAHGIIQMSRAPPNFWYVGRSMNN